MYWQKAIWQDVLQHGGSLNMPAIAMEATFLVSLGLLFGSYALLQGQNRYFELPSSFLSLSRWLTAMLAPGSPPPPAAGRLWIGSILGLAWLCLAAAGSRLARLVARVYRSSLPKRPRWLTLIYHWFLTATLLAAASLALHWVGPDFGPLALGVDLRLKAAEGSVVTPTWRTSLWHIARWPVTLAMVGSAFGLFYRLSPQRWQRGAPLWPGVLLSLAVGGAGMGLFWGLNAQITPSTTAYGLLLQLAMALTALFGLALVVPLGAQFNVSLVNQNHVAMPFTEGFRTAATPPSFDSFKINRGARDQFPRE